MSKLFIFTIFLLLSFGLIHASRPNVGFGGHSSLDEGAMEMRTELEVENCDEAVEGKEECLMRRTLAAHVDYIYTQKHKPKN
ncbi:phytosulfokines-like [Prosopis cineraria]|uniref:phytosulfokines-like n=1 Tax=Prosopis cineraria TaxID=364024 RepID=UPI00240F708A|nr:phytosulfokines-like [Prosopis cineraria]XP_054799682.1 phytosulfokines-like [Prosopis cineraria]